MKYAIGVDIGGTNTDAVLLDNKKKIIAFVKTPTTQPIERGFINALSSLLEKSKISLKNISGVFVGTTHGVNAILEKKNLFKVGLIRIAGQFPEVLPPCFEMPQDLRSSILAGYVTINGGYDCDGKKISLFDKNEAKIAIKDLIGKGAQSIAVISVFSPIYNDLENEIYKLIKETVNKNFPVSLSHKIGKIGFIERENSTILNASLQLSLKLGFNNLAKILNKLNIKAPLYFTQNNGSLVSLKQALEYPILTVSSGPANSFIGAARLAKKQNCVVVDIGGTSTDIGVVKNGYVRRSLNLSRIGGVSLNFSMPDFLSAAIGGGSKISITKHEIIIGPESVGRNLTKEAVCFGGNTLTLTDIALVSNSSIINSDKRINVSDKKSQKILDMVLVKIKQLIFQMEGKEKKMPVIVVGGGAVLFKNNFGDKRFMIPKYHDVANAYGAALGEISATEDVIVELRDREKTLRTIKQKAISKARAKGSDPSTIRIVDLQIIPYHYVPNCLARVVATAMGSRK